MIFLDTNYLIALVGGDRVVDREIKIWLQRGEMIKTSVVAWSEFLTKPVDDETQRRIKVLIDEQIIPLGLAEAECAARIYREARCKRSQRLDTFIAATAIVAGGLLATRNRRDFDRFVPMGLKLV